MAYTEEDVKTWLKYPKTGIWYVIIPGTDGKWKSSGRTNEPAAIRWALDAASEGGPRKVTILRDFAKDFAIPGKCSFVASREADGQGARTVHHWRDVRRVIDLYLLPRWGAWNMEGVPPDEFHEWVLGLKGERFDRPLSPRLKKRVRDAALDLWDWAVFKRRIRFNQLRSTPKISGKGAKRRRFTEAERELMFSDLSTWPRGRPVLRCAVSPAWGLAALFANHGLRPQEVLALHWEDLFHDKKAFVVRRKLSEGEEREGLKTRVVEKRVVRMGPQLEKATAIGKWLTGPIFRRHDGGLCLVTSFNNAFCKYLDSLEGFERGGRTVYSLRHSKNTSEVTEALSRVRQEMGHVTTAMTAHYDDPDLEDLFRREGL